MKQSTYAMKTIPTILALAAFAAFATPAKATTYTYTGDTTYADTWFRPFDDFSGRSDLGRDSRYQVFDFTVSQTGDYTFLSSSTSNWTGSTVRLWDNFTHLYQSSFDPASPFENGVIGNDDDGSRSTSGFTQALTAGTEYFFVTSGFTRAEYGTYFNTITGPGSVLPAGTDVPPVPAVPEPSAYALMMLGLAAVGAIARRRKA